MQTGFCGSGVVKMNMMCSINRFFFIYYVKESIVCFMYIDIFALK